MHWLGFVWLALLPPAIWITVLFWPKSAGERSSLWRRIRARYHAFALLCASVIIVPLAFVPVSDPDPMSIWIISLGLITASMVVGIWAWFIPAL